MCFRTELPYGSVDHLQRLSPDADVEDWVQGDVAGAGELLSVLPHLQGLQPLLHRAHGKLRRRRVLPAGGRQHQKTLVSMHTWTLTAACNLLSKAICFSSCCASQAEGNRVDGVGLDSQSDTDDRCMIHHCSDKSLLCLKTFRRF